MARSLERRQPLPDQHAESGAAEEQAHMLARDHAEAVELNTVGEGQTDA